MKLGDLTPDMVTAAMSATRDCCVTCAVSLPLYTADLRYNPASCQLHEFSANAATVGCVRNGQQEEHRSLVEDLVGWCRMSHLQLNATKEMLCICLPCDQGVSMICVPEISKCLW